MYELIGDVKTEGSLSWSDYVSVEFAVLRDMRQVKTKINVLKIRKAKFQLFKDHPGKLLSATKKQLEQEN